MFVSLTFVDVVVSFGLFVIVFGLFILSLMFWLLFAFGLIYMDALRDVVCLFELCSVCWLIYILLAGCLFDWFVCMSLFCWGLLFGIGLSFVYFGLICCRCDWLVAMVLCLLFGFDIWCEWFTSLGLLRIEYVLFVIACNFDVVVFCDCCCVLAFSVILW